MDKRDALVAFKQLQQSPDADRFEEYKAWFEEYKDDRFEDYKITDCCLYYVD